MRNIDVPYTVCLSVYKNDCPKYFLAAIRSVAQQTIMPYEIILTIDGPISSELEESIVLFQKEYPSLRIIRFLDNKGHAAARQAAIEAAKTDLIAIMDSDDISISNRMELELQYLQQHPEVDIVGGQIEEFIENESNIVGKRVVPLQDGNIKKYLKKRCPMNLVTVFFKKDAIQRVGGFIDWYCEEDYYLWIRMAEAGCVFANIDKTLVFVRVGNEMYQRRGGWKYFKSEEKIQRYMFTHKLIRFHTYLYNTIIRFILQVLMPNKLRGFIFQKFART